MIWIFRIIIIIIVIILLIIITMIILVSVIILIIISRIIIIRHIILIIRIMLVFITHNYTCNTSKSDDNLRELGLANRRKLPMSCVHACVGSFGAITRVCQMGGGRKVHLRYLALSCVTRAPESRFSKAGLLPRVTPTL